MVATEACGVLPNLVQVKLAEGQQTFAVRVRDDEGNLIYAGEMTIDGERHEPPSPRKVMQTFS